MDMQKVLMKLNVFLIEDYELLKINNVWDKVNKSIKK